MTPRAATPLEPAPASPRVSEELVEQVAAMLDVAAFAPEVMGNFSWEDQRNNARRKATAIITLAQAELLPWLRHRPDCRKGQQTPNVRWGCDCGFDDATRAIRAMMVKP